MSKVLILYIFTILITATISCHAIAQDIVVKPINTNSSLKNDFAPFVHDSTLYFASNRKNEILKSYIDQNNELLYRIYKVAILPNDDFGNPNRVKSPEFSNLNTGSVWINQNNNLIYFCQNQYNTIKRSKGRENLLGIYYTENDGRKWSRPKSYEFNSRRDYSVAHPCLTPDGKTLFFTSNMPNGLGETDIYKSELVNGEWTEPVNLGSKINTKGKEIFPFYHPSGKLYFSSNGRNSDRTDFDIYYSVFDGQEWSEPQRLENPINSKQNDFSCYIYDSEMNGYFASDRDGSDNIYYFSTPFPTFSNPTEMVVDNFCFTLYDDGPYQSDTVPCIYKWYFSDGAVESGKEVDHCFPGPGNYTVNLNVYDTIQQVDLFNVATYELPLEKTQQIIIECPDTVKVNQTIELTAVNSELKDFVPKEYYWILDNNNKSKGVTIQYIFRNTGTFSIVCGATAKNNPRYKLASKKEIVVIE